MPMPGEINSPVCWSNANGQEYSQGTRRLANATPWKHPWQIPIGVMKEATTQQTAVQIQTVGEFRVPLTDIYPHLDTDLMFPNDLYGRRVYYDWYTGSYIVQEVPIEEPDESTPAAIYPGSATIGYITDVNTTDNDVGIMIDPRPPTATYDVYLAETSLEWLQGTPITLDPATRMITPYDESSTRFDGVAVWWLKPHGEVPSQYAEMVVVTSGPTWYMIDPNVFYTKNPRSDVLGATPTCVPIDINGAACPAENEDGAIIIGNVTLRMWYPQTTTQSFPTFAMLDVRHHIPKISPILTTINETKEA